MAAMEERENFRQHIGSQRGDDADLQPPDEQPFAVPRDIDDVARRGQDALGAPRHLGAGLGERDLARPPLHQLDAEGPLQVADLHRQGRLRDRAGLGGAAEMPVLRQGGEIVQLPQGDHSNKLILSYVRGNTIGPDG